MAAGLDGKYSVSEEIGTQMAEVHVGNFHVCWTILHPVSLSHFEKVFFSFFFPESILSLEIRLSDQEYKTTLIDYTPPPDHDSSPPL